MNGLFLWGLAVVVLAAAVAGAIRALRHKRQERLRVQGYELIFSLKTYSAWVDCQIDEPWVHGEPDDLVCPAPLARAREIKEAAFPALSMLRLLQAHSRLVEYLWQQNLLRLTQASGWRPGWQDPHYRQIRGAQEELIQEMIGLCQEMIGDGAHEWHRTGTDFAFSSSIISTTQGS
jgi:hypothetical protein